MIQFYDTIRCSCDILWTTGRTQYLKNQMLPRSAHLIVIPQDCRLAERFSLSQKIQIPRRKRERVRSLAVFLHVLGNCLYSLPNNPIYYEEEEKIVRSAENYANSHRTSERRPILYTV